MTIVLVKVKRVPAIPFWAVLALICSGIIIVAGLVLYDFSGRPIPFCIFKLFTGLPCPTCGLMRSFERLLSGDVFGAFVSNPFFFSAGLVIGALGFVRLVFGIAPRVEASNREKLAAGAIVLLLIAGNWIFLILDSR